MPRLRALITLSLATTLFVPAFAEGTNPARPGTINYIEGQATLNGQPVASNTRAELSQGQTVATTNGKVEVLLTPGVFLRLGENSSVTMISPDLTQTEVQLNSGRVEVEVDQIYKQNDLLIDRGSTQTKLLDHGLYAFDATASTLQVFDGKAAVSPSEDATKWITVKGGHQLALTGTAVKAVDFDRKEIATSDALYNWGKLRSEYLGEANLKLAQEYAGSAGVYSGWSWDPALYSYTWLPGEGLSWSPFGYGFYSPYYLYGGGLIYPGYARSGYYGGGYGFREGYGFRGGDGMRGAYAAPAVHGFGGRGFSTGGGFHGGGGGFHGGSGGFHGGGGGFHGDGGRR
jgi:hypothetical protein